MALKLLAQDMALCQLAHNLNFAEHILYSDQGHEALDLGLRMTKCKGPNEIGLEPVKDA